MGSMTKKDDSWKITYWSIASMLSYGLAWLSLIWKSNYSGMWMFCVLCVLFYYFAKNEENKDGSK